MISAKYFVKGDYSLCNNQQINEESEVFLTKFKCFNVLKQYRTLLTDKMKYEFSNYIILHKA